MAVRVAVLGATGATGRLLVDELVRRGHTVGHAGSTGRSTGTHLHYEVWIDGRAVNPLHYLVDREPQ